MNSATQQARERAQDFMAANPGVQHIVVLYSGGHFMLDSSGNETVKPKETSHENRINHTV